MPEGEKINKHEYDIISLSHCIATSVNVVWK
jgi:hypothetical protein